MARIRTIKPEFPQSESMGRVSRDARLLFVMLWTICDDHGRTRAHSRMLASLLFPYDDDAGEGIKAWLAELEEEGCIRLYEHSGSQYLEVTGWRNHQRIDKPSKPQFPAPPDDTLESSSTPRKSSCEEGKGREGKGREGSKNGVAADAADFKSALFTRWKSLPEGGGGAFLNKLFRDHKPEQRVVEAVERTLDDTRADPKAFVLGVLRKESASEAAYDAAMATAI